MPVHVEVERNIKIVVGKNRNQGKVDPLYEMVWRIFVFLGKKDYIGIKRKWLYINEIVCNEKQ